MRTTSLQLRTLRLELVSLVQSSPVFFAHVWLQKKTHKTLTFYKVVRFAAKILSGLGQTLMSVYTVPAGKTAYLLDLHMGSDKVSTNTAMTYRLFAGPFGGAFNIKGNFNAVGGQNLDINYPVPLRFDEKSDIKVDVIAGQTTQVSATFDLILVDNE